MTKYKCGHKCDTIIANNSPLMIADWLEWKDDVGFDGDKSQCWDCYCNTLNRSLEKNDG